MKVVAVTFADHKCYKGQNNLKSFFLEKCNIDEVISWKWDDYKNTKYYIDHKPLYDSHPRGLGYWSWKPCVIYESMKTISDGDYILYHDSGRNCYNYNPCYDVRPFIEYIDACCNGLGVFFGRYQHNELTKRDCFVYMNCDDPKYYNNKQIVATWHFWKKSDFCLRLLEEWMYWCFHEKRIISNDKSENPELATFRCHRHDQSILTNLVLREHFNGNIPVLLYNRGMYRGWEKNINVVLRNFPSKTLVDKVEKVKEVKEDIHLMIIIPIRNRENQLEDYFKYMNPIFKEQQVIPHYVIVYQDDEKPFNKGVISNYGYLYATKHFPHAYFLFNDVDIYPRSSNILRYDAIPFDKNTVYHRYGYRHIIGGFFLTNKDAFQHINGYSTSYSGWGYEDCDLNERCRIKNVRIDRNNFTRRTWKSNPKYFDIWLQHEQRQNARRAMNTTKKTFYSIWKSNATNDDLENYIQNNGLSSLHVEDIHKAETDSNVDFDLTRIYVRT